ncbi:hypothetical protein [Absidia glauca]|uniref:Heterokaryon incompatibility domain-containing protein n=1 Tax=Absidia glauca TaxID=4829 RepID=A0A163LTD7_ABSGL|nr:hypothetical protein [Absidia glauca]
MNNTAHPPPSKPSDEQKALPADPSETTPTTKKDDPVATKRAAVPISSAKKRSDVAEASTAVSESGPKIDIDKPSKEDRKEFEIVLVDMVASVISQKLVCVKRNMYDEDPDFSYACVSYRWGEVDEQIALTPDYNAHITSFSLDDLLIVCQQILNWSSDGGLVEEVEESEEEAEGDEEAEGADVECGEGVKGEEDTEADNQEEEEEEEDWDEQHHYSETTIQYLWVDAISVDQMDVAHKKATIHRMTEIYSQAKVIVAVPDLHRSHLFDNPASAECLSLISKYGRRFCRHITMDCWYHEEEENEEESVDGEEQEQQEEEDSTETETLHDDSGESPVPKHRGFRQFLKETIYHHSDSNTEGKLDDEKTIGDLSVGSGGGSQISLATKDIQSSTNGPTEPEEQDEATEEQSGEADGEDGEEESEEGEEEEEEERLCLCTDDMTEEEAVAYYKAANLLEWMVRDWSNRVWVISEYSIGRHSNMKLWFVSICYDNYSTRPRQLFDMFNPDSPILYNELLEERPLLNIFLNSKATRNEDRFVAMLPLFREFKQYVTSNALSTWNITDMVSVRLRLLRIVSFKEKLAILLSCTLPSFISDIILPSFATAYKPLNLNWAIELSQKESMIKELDLEEDGTMDYMRVTVPWSRTFTESAVQHDLDVSTTALSKLGLDSANIVTVFIPITVHDERTNHTLGIKLFGDRSKNKWIILHRMVDLVDVLPTTPHADTAPSSPHEDHPHPHPPHRSASLDTLWSDKHEADQVFHIY